MHSSRAGFRLSSAFLLVPLFLWPAKGSCLPWGGPQDWSAQSVAQTAYSPKWVSACIISLSPRVLSRGTSSDMITFSSFLSDYVCISLIALVYRNLSANFQLVFRKKCFTCTFLFDVFTSGGKFPILLLCHVDWSAMPTFLWRDVSDFKESNDLKKKARAENSNMWSQKLKFTFLCT